MKSKNNFNKKDIYKFISKKKGYSVLLSKKIVDHIIEIMVTQLKQNNLILKNIGSFKIVDKKERTGRNPKTKELFLINARKSIVFKASKKLLKSINKYSD